ncbi:hypothetical protein PQR46_05280, partial [Paraburkholderia sediminicola]|uniref:hypothetical protein n=1 Tax=Paraburkholderia sediminicola TaxID=458836 RepID=UPI0038BA224D
RMSVNIDCGWAQGDGIRALGCWTVETCGSVALHGAEGANGSHECQRDALGGKINALRHTW